MTPSPTFGATPGTSANGPVESVLSALGPGSLGFYVALAVVVVLVVVVCARVGIVELKAPFGFSMRRDSAEQVQKAKEEAKAAVAERDSLALTLRQYAEVAEALPAAFSGNPEEIERSARNWFDALTTRLANCLKSDHGQLFRAAIWLNDPSVPDSFVAVGRTQGAFSVNGDKRELLRKKDTIGGLAFKAAKGICYVQDTKTDKRFLPKPAKKAKYRSVYAMALGAKPRWGVMTIDADRPNAFGEREVSIVEVFAGLASVAAEFWAEKTIPADKTATICETAPSIVKQG